MTRRRSRKLKEFRPLLARGAAGGEEDRTSVAVTVAWMLTVLCTLAAELLALACYAAARFRPAEGESWTLRLMALSLVIALVTGACCLVLAPIAYRVRRVKPPRAIVVAAVLVGLLPAATLVVFSWLLPLPRGAAP